MTRGKVHGKIRFNDYADTLPVCHAMFEYYVERVQGVLPIHLSASQMKGAFGEIATVFQLQQKLRHVFPHPFPNPKVEYTPDFSSSFPDVTVVLGSSRIAIEVKHWQFIGPITSAHVYEVSKKTGVKLFLSIYPKQLTSAAKRALRYFGIRFVNGLSRLLDAFKQICRETHTDAPTSCLVGGPPFLGRLRCSILSAPTLDVPKGGGFLFGH